MIQDGIASENIRETIYYIWPSSNNIMKDKTTNTVPKPADVCQSFLPLSWLLPHPCAPLLLQAQDPKHRHQPRRRSHHHQSDRRLCLSLAFHLSLHLPVTNKPKWDYTPLPLQNNRMFLYEHLTGAHPSHSQSPPLFHLRPPRESNRGQKAQAWRA